MITNLIAPIAHKDEALKGISRSRLSFHFNTARKRRWLLVQFVTAPALTTEDQANRPTTYTRYTPERHDYNNLIQSYQACRLSTPGI